MAKKKKKRKVKSMIFPKILLVAFVVYSIVTLISLQIQRNDGEDNVAVLESQVKEERLKQEQLTQLLEDEVSDEYIVSEAQKSGYAAPEERVFKDVAGQ